MIRMHSPWHAKYWIPGIQRGGHPPVTDPRMLSWRVQNMMRFNDADALREYLTNFDASYESYAAGMWTLGGMRNTDMIANSPLETLATVLAHPAPPVLMHVVHASDIQTKCKAVRLAGMFVAFHGGFSHHPVLAILRYLPEISACIPHGFILLNIPMHPFHSLLSLDLLFTRKLGNHMISLTGPCHADYAISYTNSKPIFPPQTFLLNLNLYCLH